QRGSARSIRQMAQGGRMIAFLTPSIHHGKQKCLINIYLRCYWRHHATEVVVVEDEVLPTWKRGKKNSGLRAGLRHVIDKYPLVQEFCVVDGDVEPDFPRIAEAVSNALIAGGVVSGYRRFTN